MRLSVLLLAAALALTGAGCSLLEDDKLAALKAEDVATLIPSGGTLLREREIEEHTALGKPRAATLLRSFSFSTKRQADSGWTAVIGEAQASGWSMTLDRVDPSYPVRGAKVLDTGPAMISVGKYRNDLGIHIVTITLLHRQCPETTCRSA